MAVVVEGSGDGGSRGRTVQREGECSARGMTDALSGAAKQVLAKLEGSPLSFGGFKMEPWLDCKYAQCA